jgi:hypothetical protein
VLFECTGYSTPTIKCNHITNSAFYYYYESGGSITIFSSFFYPRCSSHLVVTHPPNTTTTMSSLIKWHGEFSRAEISPSMRCTGVHFAIANDVYVHMVYGTGTSRILRRKCQFQCKSVLCIPLQSNTQNNRCNSFTMLTVGSLQFRASPFMVHLDSYHSFVV